MLREGLAGNRVLLEGGCTGDSEQGCREKMENRGNNMEQVPKKKGWYDCLSLQERKGKKFRQTSRRRRVPPFSIIKKVKPGNRENQNKQRKTPERCLKKCSV